MSEGLRWPPATGASPFRSIGGWKMPKDVAAEYRARADKCQQRAEKSRDPVDNAYWIEFAEQWMKLAQEADRARQPSDSSLPKPSVGHVSGEHPPTPWPH